MQMNITVLNTKGLATRIKSHSGFQAVIIAYQTAFKKKIIIALPKAANLFYEAMITC